jgi:DNA (cytosine-5)-methyltransferase 1
MRQGRLWQNVANELDSLGYAFHYAVLHAADFGVPQMRKRLIVIGSREGAPAAHPLPTHGPGSADASTLFDVGLKPYVSAGEAIADLPQIEQGTTSTTYSGTPLTDYQKLMREGAGSSLHNHVATKHRKTTSDYYALIPPGGNAMDVPKELRNGKQGIQRWPIDGLSRTITTEPTDFLHPYLDRIPTIREIARIQSFPDRFEFMGQRTTGNKLRRLGYCSQSQQVGNAVPPLLARAIGESLVEKLTGSRGDVRFGQMSEEAGVPVEGMLADIA